MLLTTTFLNFSVIGYGILIFFSRESKQKVTTTGDSKSATKPVIALSVRGPVGDITRIVRILDDAGFIISCTLKVSNSRGSDPTSKYLMALVSSYHK